MKVVRTTVLYTHGGGRFGNQLLRFFHWLAWVAEEPEKRRIVNMAFWPYAHLFHPWAESPGCVYPHASARWDYLAHVRRVVPTRFRNGFDWRIPRWTAALARLLNAHFCTTRTLNDHERLDLESLGAAPSSVEGTMYVCSGWQYTCWQLVESSAATLRGLFIPVEPYASRARSFVSSARGQADVLVGLLIRRTDYREWNQGRYFFPMPSYAAWLGQIPELFPGKNVSVIIACDEWLSLHGLGDGHIHLATGSVNRGGHWFESFLELAACDWIVAPPSTFAACAAFIGDAQLLPLRDRNQQLDLRDGLRPALLEGARDPDVSQAVR